MGYLISIKNYSVPHKNKDGNVGGGVTYITYNGNGSGGYNGNSFNTTNLNATNARIHILEGDELNFKFGYIGELESDNIITGKLFADEIEADKANIKNIDAEDITTEYLTVTKQAHFFELIIDKVRSVGGQIILTPASAALDKVFAYSDAGSQNLVSDPVVNFSSVHHFNVYWRSENELGLGVTNDWVVGDQAYCQSFNNVKEGVNHDVSNKYYWRLVDAILPDKMINFATNKIRDVNDVLTGTNNISISMGQSMFQGEANGISWSAEIQEEYMGVSWDNYGASAQYSVSGVMHTSSTIYGIKILPTGEYSDRSTDQLSFHIYNTDGNVAQEKMNISVYFKDGTSLFFPNITLDANFNCILDLGNPDQEINRIIIYCGQPVQWHKCHGIQLSNTVMDNYKDVRGVIPEAGDNIVQLGFRGTDEYDDRKRQSAIIISAYMSIDTDLKAPSYAQYEGINDFNLKTHRKSYIDATGAKFMGTHEGDITMCIVDENGNTITDMVIDQKGIHTEVNDLSGQVSQFEQTVQGFTMTVQSYTQAVDGYSQQVSQFSQTVDGFNLTVGNYTTAVNGYSQQVSTFSQTVDGFNTTVSNYTTAVNGYSNQYSQVIQNYNNIKAEVVSDINGELLSTGIDITQGTILLKANKVTFCDSSGNNTDKISIDPTNGTLKAVNATLSGTLTIKQNNNDGLRLDSDGNIQRWNGSAWINLFAQRNVNYVTSNYTCGNLDDMILVGSSGVTIYLPSSPKNGRQMTIRNIGSRNWCRINAGSHNLNIGGSDTDHDWNWADLNNDDRVELVYYNNTWYWNVSAT